MQELDGLLEWSFPSHWRKKFDLDGYIPTLGTKAKLISECKAIKRNESVKDKERKNNNDNNNNNKKNKFGKFDARAKNNDCLRNVYFCARTAGATTHMIRLNVFFSRTRPNGSKKEI
jgi:hypothetical protein